MTFQIGDKAKLKYNGFKYCPRGSIVKITNIMPNENIVVIHKKEIYVVANADLIELPQKEKVDFT